MIGPMRERVLLQRPVREDDAINGGEISRVDVATVWARVETPTTSRNVIAEAVRLSASYTVTIRHRSDIQANWRLIWDGQPLDIASIGPALDVRRRYLVLTCNEVAGVS